MKLSARYLYLAALLLTVLFGFASSRAVSLPFIVKLGLLAFTLFAPGMLILAALKVSLKNIWLYILYSLGFSIIVIYALGLLSSTLFLLLKINRPLDALPFIYFYSAFNFVLLLIGAIRHGNTQIIIDYHNRIILKFAGYLIVLLLSVMSIAGAFILNNGGSNLLILAWLIALSILYFLTTVFQNKRFKILNPYIIFLLSLSLLWALAARSWHIAGWDIVQEYFMARITQKTGLWSMATFKDAYNACLSITILPTVISNLTAFSVEDILKYIFPFIFAHFSVAVYFWLKKLTNATASMLAVFYIVAQSFFIQPMVALARQEIAFFFFSLLLLSIYNIEQKKARVFITVSILFGLVVSHYSTTYVSVALFTAVLIVILALKLMKFIPFPKSITNLSVYANWIKNYKSSFGWWVVILLIAFTYLWYFAITGIGWAAASLLEENLGNISTLFNGKQQSREVQLAVSGKQISDVTTTIDMQAFLGTSVANVHNLPSDRLNFYVNHYPLVPVTETYINPYISSKTASLGHLWLSRLKEVLKYLVLLGALVMVLKTFKKSKQNIDLIIFCGISTTILVAMLVHPTIGLYYNISRIYLQLLVFLGVALIICLETFLFFLHKKVRVALIGVSILLSLFYLQGLVVPLIGGVPFMFLYNTGTDFEKFYVYQEELQSVVWLQRYRNVKNTVFGDTLSRLKLVKEANIFPNTSLLPVTMANDRESYVYLTATNKINQKAQVFFSNKFLTYEYPQKYLDENRDLVYSNKRSSIYR